MQADTDILEAAGVPYGAPRKPGRWPGERELRLAVERLAAEAVPAELEDAVLAWLSGFEHHWPEEFQRSVGEAGTRLLTRLELRARDWNRYLKLRRIAIENLAARGSAAGAAAPQPLGVGKGTT